MHLRRICFLIPIFLAMGSSCRQQSLAEQPLPNSGLIPIDTLRWLTGYWKSESSEGIYVEHWQKSGDTCYLGESFMAKGTDTLFTEKIVIRYVNDTICYIPAVSNQNQALPVKFTMLKLSGDTIVFYNPHHDFPQRITYAWIKPDSLHAWIDGTDKGIARREDFRMVRLR